MKLTHVDKVFRIYQYSILEPEGPETQSYALGAYIWPNYILDSLGHKPIIYIYIYTDIYISISNIDAHNTADDL